MGAPGHRHIRPEARLGFLGLKAPYRNCLPRVHRHLELHYATKRINPIVVVHPVHCIANVLELSQASAVLVPGVVVSLAAGAIKALQVGRVLLVAAPHVVVRKPLSRTNNGLLGGGPPLHGLLS